MSSENNSVNSIVKRIYIAADVELASPLSISNGTAENTDSDVLKNASGEVFIPGTAIAGAMRNYLGLDKNKNCVFGYADGENGKMSSLFISDAYIQKLDIKNDENKKYSISVRDGVGLTEGKTAIPGAKYDYEVVETGKAVIRIEKVIRAQDENSDGVEEIRELLSAVQQGAIRFGFKKNRGLGRLRINKVYKWEFASGKENAENWVCYCSETEEERRKRPGCLWKDWEKQEVSTQKYVSITIPLKLTGGISIRKYSTRPEEADFEQLTIQQIFENGEEKQSVPVIPGTSWAGAVRSRTKKLLKDLNCSEEAAERMINGWFGYVDVKAEKGKKTAQQSMIVIGESVLKNSVPLVTTRNKINRFSAATVDGALYTEKAYFGGETQLEIKIRKDKENCYQLLAAMLSFVAADIVRGYLSVGGQTAIGRGIFEGNGPVTGTISEQDMELYKKQLAAMIQEGVC